MSDLMNVSASPHVRSKETTSSIMLDVIIALIPAAAFGVYNFGFRALAIILITIATCVLSEYIYEKCMHKKSTILDLSAVVTGLLLAMNLPSTVPYWLPVIGGVFAIIIVKQLFGGVGQNFMNPALAARCFLMIAFAARMTTFTYDAVTGPTPLALLKQSKSVDVLNMFVGNIAGTIGETSAIALIFGGLYLVCKRVISLRIPLSYIGTFAVFIILYAYFNGRGFDGQFILAHLCGGGLMLGAIFMATDYATSPITIKGQIVYGIILGLLTGLFRCFGGSAEGVSFAIIFSNLLVPIIEKYTKPVPFGHEKKQTSGEKKAGATPKILKDAAMLFLITVVAGLLLGGVYAITKDPIKKANENAKQDAYKAVFSEADTFVENDEIDIDNAEDILKDGGFNNSSINEVLVAKDSDGNEIGYVMSLTSHEGYGGDISFSMGIKSDGTVTGIEFLSISETAGLGMKATESSFKSQFADKNVEKFEYTKTHDEGDNKIDALSGATITTNAVTNTVNAGIYYIDSIGGEGNE